VRLSNAEAKAKTKASIGARPSRVYHAQARSRITNGSHFLPGTDGRSLWVRRARDIIATMAADLGGDDRLSAAQMSLVRRCAVLQVELERRELLFAEAGEADDDALDIYARVSKTLRIHLLSLGLQRHARDVSLNE
jgi:hypothetical protein